MVFLMSRCPYETAEPLSSDAKGSSSRGLKGCMKLQRSLSDSGFATNSFKEADKKPFASVWTAFYPQKETPWNCVNYNWKPLKDLWLRLWKTSALFSLAPGFNEAQARLLSTCSDVGSLCSMCRNSCSYLGNFSPSKEAHGYFNCLDSWVGTIYTEKLGQVTIFCLAISCTAHWVSSELP